MRSRPLATRMLMMLAVATCLMWAGMAGAAPAHAATLQLEPLPLELGQPAVARACLGKGVKRAFVVLMGRDTDLVKAPDGCWVGAVAPDLQDKTGTHLARVMADGKPAASARVKVVEPKYGVRRIKVNPKFMKLKPADLARHKREIKAQKKVYASMTPTRFWRGAFAPPVPGDVTGPFGRKSVINGQPRSPHGGVDLRGGKGTPVKATGAGRVALVQDSYFGGLVVLIDHGHGLISGYRHLDKALVKKGQQVAKGQVIGKVGMSGRVTGPHLHYDVHLAGARVDPLAWQVVSAKLARTMGGK